jgi:toxin ParE1/3/4
MIVVLTETAIADLVAIGRHIKTDNPRRAAIFVAEIESRCHKLGSMPKAFALVPDTKAEACADAHIGTT